MKRISIVIDIHCVKLGQRAAYRIYVDQDLITERDWVWPASKIFVRENLHVDLAQGQHGVKVESLSSDTEFKIKGCIVDGKTVADANSFLI